MRIAPNHFRLRVVALVCLGLGVWWLLQPQLLVTEGMPPALVIGGTLLAALLLAIAASFWMLATDRRAGVILDRKGLSLNLGYSSAFVSWENIAAVGVTRRRSSVFAIGSHGQLGIRLHDPEQYLQSYEQRLPAAPGILARAVRLLARLSSGSSQSAAPSLRALERLRRRTGYDIVIPEAQLGRRAEDFVALLESYRPRPASAA